MGTLLITVDFTGDGGKAPPSHVFQRSYDTCRFPDFSPGAFRRVVFTCGRTGEERWPPTRITLSNGGGVSGMQTGYTLHPDGLVTYWVGKAGMRERTDTLGVWATSNCRLCCGMCTPRRCRPSKPRNGQHDHHAGNHGRRGSCSRYSCPGRIIEDSTPVPPGCVRCATYTRHGERNAQLRVIRISRHTHHRTNVASMNVLPRLSLLLLLLAAACSEVDHGYPHPNQPPDDLAGAASRWKICAPPRAAARALVGRRSGRLHCRLLHQLRQSALEFHHAQRQSFRAHALRQRHHVFLLGARRG